MLSYSFLYVKFKNFSRTTSHSSRQDIQVAIILISLCKIQGLFKDHHSHSSRLDIQIAIILISLCKVQGLFKYHQSHRF